MESSYRRRITLRGITLSCRGITLSHFSVPFKRTSQTSRRFDFELHCSNESRGSNFSNETMEKIEYDAFRYSYTMIIVFGIFGNILVILSILRQERNVLRNNYYFLVLHLAICDLAVLIFFLFDTLEHFWLGNTNSSSKIIPCPVHYIGDAFQLAGVGMMLFISLLRYRATVHPLKPATSQRKWSRLWTDVLRWLDCGRRNTFAGGATRLPRCFIKSTVAFVTYRKFYVSFGILFGCFIPTIFMCVVYSGLARALIKHNKLMKTVCSNAIRRRTPDSTFNILRYLRHRRAVLVCLSIVLCYGISRIPVSVWPIWFITGKYHLRVKYGWLAYVSYTLKVAGSHSVNPLIYGILDKKLVIFWKGCCRKKRRTYKNQNNAVAV